MYAGFACSNYPRLHLWTDTVGVSPHIQERERETETEKPNERDRERQSEKTRERETGDK